MTAPHRWPRAAHPKRAVRRDAFPQTYVYGKARPERSRPFPTATQTFVPLNSHGKLFSTFSSRTAMVRLLLFAEGIYTKRTKTGACILCNNFAILEIAYGFLKNLTLDLRFCLFFWAFYSGFAAGSVVGSKHGTNTGRPKPKPFSATKPRRPDLVRKREKQPQ
ncbi:MAG: hypothetical protein ACI4OI_03440 [Gemmiger sp.]